MILIIYHYLGHIYDMFTLNIHKVIPVMMKVSPGGIHGNLKLHLHIGRLKLQRRGCRLSSWCKASVVSVAQDGCGRVIIYIYILYIIVI